MDTDGEIFPASIRASGHERITSTTIGQLAIDKTKNPTIKGYKSDAASAIFQKNPCMNDAPFPSDSVEVHCHVPKLPGETPKKGKKKSTFWEFNNIEHGYGR